MSAPVRQRERRAIPLNMITGRSPANCRADAPDADVDVAGLAVSIDAIGLIQPLLVSAVPGPRLLFHVDAGGRRLAALRQLVEHRKLTVDAPIECEVLVADDGLSREISLAENTMRRDLHPVEQCAAFEAMRAAGLSEDKIAADFGITVRQVRQRLKLTKLSPRVRAAWRDGVITLEVAQAFTVAASHEAQDALLDGGEAWLLGNAHQVRLRLLNGVVQGNAPEAIYVGLDAYCAAGGAIDENLFQEHPLILDPALLSRLARDKMMSAGEAILEEHGFHGFCMVRSDVEKSWNWPRVAPDILPEERRRLEEINEARNADVALDGATDARLAAEQTAIRRRAIARACTQEMRATVGVFVDLDHDGDLVVELGVRRPMEAPGRATTSDDVEPERPSPAATAPSKPADPVEVAGSGLGMIRTILQGTIERAFVAIVGHRPDLALLYLVARYGGSYRPEWVASHDQIGLEPYNTVGGSVLPSVSGKGFDGAVAACADAPLADLTTATCAIVARSIRLGKGAPLTALDALMHAFGRRGAALGPAFVGAMDYDAYFAAATRAACLHALEAMTTPLVDRQAKKPVLAALAAAEAAKKAWLPFPLAGWAAVERDSPEAVPETERAADVPLADAMAEAIAADETASLGRSLATAAAICAFLSEDVVEDAGGQVKTEVLYDRYRASVVDPTSWEFFDDEVWSLGFELDERGQHYVGIQLRILA